MLFSGGMIPTFILVKGVGLIDSRWAMVLPCLINTWNLLIMRNFFYGIPKSLEEAAVIDGANDAQVLVKIVLPLSKASIATIGLFYAVSHWNAWFDAMLYINTTALLPMQYRRPGRRSIQLPGCGTAIPGHPCRNHRNHNAAHPGGISVCTEIFCKRCNGRFCKRLTDLWSAF